MEFCSKLCGSQDEKGVWGRMDTCIYMAECLHCSPETSPILLIGDTPIQNLKLKHTHIHKQTCKIVPLLASHQVKMLHDFLIQR